MHCLWSIANNPISVQIEKWIHSVSKQYLKIYSLFYTKILQAYVVNFSVNNDKITNVSIEWNLSYAVSKLGVIFFGTPCIKGQKCIGQWPENNLQYW